MKISNLFGRLSNGILHILYRKRTRTIALAFILVLVMVSLSYLSAIAQKEVREPDQGHTAVPLGSLAPPDHVYAPVEVKPPENATEVSKPAPPGNYSTVSTNEEAPRVARRLNVESPHPYWNDMDWWFPVYAPPEANQMCLRFRIIDVEYSYDFVEVYDSSLVLQASYTGYYSGWWTPWIGGNMLWIRLRSDSSNAYWGFAVDRLSWGAPVYAESPHPYPDSYYNEWWIDGSPNDKSEYFSTYFPTIETEAGFDYVRTYGYDGTWWDYWTGHWYNQWTWWDATYDMKITLTSDGSVTDWGFIADYSNENREAFVESPHNYYNYMDQSWYVFGPPEATRMRLHFSLVDVESCCDRVYLYDAYGNQVAVYAGYIPDLWTPWGNGNLMIIRLTSDYSVTNWGFRVDNYEPDLPNKSTVTFLTDPTYIPMLEREGSATAGVEVPKPCPDCSSAAAVPSNYTKHGLGYLKEMEIIAPEARVRGEVGAALASYLDWRDRNGVDWTTPIRDQGGCGSCVSFGTIATFEAALKIASGNPDWNIDLSEQHMFSCGGGKCDFGWWIAPALDYLYNYGAPYESCFPYRAWDAPCDGTCPDWLSKRHWLLDQWAWVYPSVYDIQYYLRYGPVVTAFDVYYDFFDYTGGVYRHTYGDYAGGHAVSIVGYDNAGGYWIVKNSWGPYWGENGYFRIAFGECGIEQAVARLTASSVATITIGASPDGDANPVGFSQLQDYDVTNGAFTVTANAAQNGPLFRRWETTGSVSVSDIYAQTTTFNVWGDGTLKAVFANSQFLSFADYPDMFIQGGRVTAAVAVGASHSHTPCAAAHTIDVVGTNLIVAGVIPYATSGADMRAMMDYWAAHWTGSNMMLDVQGNIMTAGGPSVNYVWKYYNDRHVLPAYFIYTPGGIYVPSTGHRYYMVNDYFRGKSVTDYAIVELYADTDRNVLLVAGISGFATYYACQWLYDRTIDGTIRDWNARAIVLKLVDSDGNPETSPPTISVQEIVSV